MDDADTIILSPEDHIMIRYEQDYKRQDIVYVSGALPGSKNGLLIVEKQF